MKNVIAIIWDFDKTLVDGYMQDPIFEDYGVDASEFWKEVNEFPNKIYREQKVRVNRDTAYLIKFIEYTQKGIFSGLSNDKLLSYGPKQKFYPGVEDFFKTTSEMLKGGLFEEYGIKVEHYIVSTGFTQVIRGTSIMPYVKEIWGCELIQNEKGEISQMGYTIDNTSKTRALFEINKGVLNGVGESDKVTVNTKLTYEQRRVDFKNMIYIADGPSDVPAFSVIKKNGGATFAIYPHGNAQAFTQVERLREDGRIDMFAEADYTEGTTANMWLKQKINEFAQRIIQDEKDKRIVVNDPPIHLT